MARRHCDCLAQAIGKEHAVGEPGQGIVQRVVGELGFGLFAFLHFVVQLICLLPDLCQQLIVFMQGDHLAQQY